jgi:hypothetical protein
MAKKKKDDEEEEILNDPLEEPDDFEGIIHPEDNILEEEEDEDSFVDEREEIEGLFAQE